MPTVFREYENIPFRIKSGTPLLIWRIALSSSIGLVVSLIFNLGTLITLSIAGIGATFVLAGYDIFKGKSALTARDKLMSDFVGGSCILFGIMFLVWAFSHQF